MSLTLAKPMNNYCVIKLESNDSITLDSGVVFFIPPPSQQENREEHKPLRGEVVGLPDELTFVQGNHNYMPWVTKMELEIGDKVIVRRPALSMALSKDQGSFFVEGEDIYIYLKYNEIVVAKRGEEVIVLNGYIIVEPIVEAPTTFLIVPDSAKKTSMSQGIIRYIGSPNKEYHVTKNGKSEDVFQSDDVPWARMENGEMKIDLVDLQVGDKIQFKSSSAVKLEQDLHRTLAGRNTILYRMQRHNIQAKL
jgi:hypothetical protein